MRGCGKGALRSKLKPHAPHNVASGCRRVAHRGHCKSTKELIRHQHTRLAETILSYSRSSTRSLIFLSCFTAPSHELSLAEEDREDDEEEEESRCRRWCLSCRLRCLLGRSRSWMISDREMNQRTCDPQCRQNSTLASSGRGAWHTGHTVQLRSRCRK